MSRPLAVVIAGGGAAGLETLLALRGLTADRVELTLVAPEDEFVYRPLVVRDEFAADRIRRVALNCAAEDAQAAFVNVSIRGSRPGKEDADDVDR
jgi:sulfide:quinone oxidoreductase